MKKISIIPAVIAVTIFIQSSAQEPAQSDSVKKKFSCFVKIKTMTDDDIAAAVEIFTADSIFIAPVEDKFIRAGSSFIKVLKKRADTAIAVTQISSLSIKYDPNIAYPDDIKARKKILRRKNAGRFLGMAFSGFVTAPLVFLGAGPIVVDSKNVTRNGKKKTSVSGSTLHLPKEYRTFQIYGHNENYIEMIMLLTKRKTNPFESIAEK